MRVIGGLFKSRHIAFPKRPDVRPMTDRMRETVFNILGETVSDKKVLDVCAGSGSIGIEALSRGAKEVTFIERLNSNCQIIRKNLESLGIQARAVVHSREAEKALVALGEAGKSFDLVFLDPPYNKGLTKKLLLHLDQSDILAPFARVIVHLSMQEMLPEDLTSLTIERKKKMGQALLAIYLYCGLPNL